MNFSTLFCANAEGFNNNIINAQVSSLEQFIQRINGHELYPLAADSDTDKVRTTRFSLFDITALINNEHKQEILQLQEHFVNDLQHSGIVISMSSPRNWIDCQCSFSYEGKNYNVVLRMTMEEYKPGYWRWAIFDVPGFEKSQFLSRKQVLPINPIEHEFYFMNMDHFIDAHHSDFYASKSNRKEIDSLSFFFGLAHSGKLRFNNCSRIVFHCTQIPGWEICVEQVDRIESSNSGWLITSITKI